MRVALVCPYDLDRPGGVQDQVVKLARWLADAGHEAVVVGPGRRGPDEGTSVLLGRPVTVPANRSRAAISLDPRAVGKVREAVGDADVVHVHEPLMPLVGPAALLGVDRPAVATLHADPSPRVRRLYRMGGSLVDRVLRRADVVTAVSPVAASVLGDRPVRIVPNGVDLAAQPSGAERHARRVAFVGRDELRKGLDVLLAAWGSVAGRIPGAELVVVGTGRREAPPSVRFLGRLSEADKRAALAGSTVLCAPNRGGESFGIVLVEGMAAGCAVVATAIPGFVHVLGGAGRLVAPDDPDALADALVAVLGDPDLAGSLATRSRERAERFDRRPVLDAYLEAYRTAGEGGRGR